MVSLSGELAASGSRLTEHSRRVAGDLPRDGTGGNRQRRGQVQLPWPAAAREVAVDRADRHLVGRGRHARAAADAGAAAGVDHVDAGLAEQLDVAALARVVADGLAPE